MLSHNLNIYVTVITSECQFLWRTLRLLANAVEHPHLGGLPPSGVTHHNHTPTASEANIKSLMVRNHGKAVAVQIRAKLFHSGHNCEALAFSYSIPNFRRRQRVTTECNRDFLTT